MRTSDFKDLIVWQKSISLVEEVYKTLKTFPSEEKFALCDQIRRSSVSIPSNIAEGHYRESLKERIHFLSIARGSLAELETQLIISKNLGYLDLDNFEKFIYEIKGIGVMLVSLINKLKTTLKP